MKSKQGIWYIFVILAFSSVKQSQCQTTEDSLVTEANVAPTEANLPVQANLDTLKLAQIIFRHGDRVPEYPYPNDLFKEESNWPEGWAQLTDEGKRQEYQLGRYLRARYTTYLNSSYVPNQVLAYSSDTDRTIMSGLLALGGMYPTNNESNWDNSVSWQPVPLHTIATEQDNLIRFKRQCPKFDELLDDFLRNSEMMKKINEDNKKLFEELSKESGVNITTINDIDSFYATMFIEDYKGLDIPEWGKSLKFNENFQYLYNLSFQAKTYTPELKRLRAGNLVKYLVNNFNERVKNTTMKTKMFILSGHDITLVDILNTFGVLDLHRPWYSSAFILELHQEPSNGNYFIELLLRNDTTREPYQLSLPGCGFQCPFEKFLNYSNPIIPNNWDEECLTAPAAPVDDGHSIFTYVIIALGILALIVFIVAIGCMCMQRRRKAVQRNDYQHF